MAIPLASLATTPYNIGAPQVIPNVVATRGEHKIYTPTRIAIVWTPDANNPNVRNFTGNVNPAGDTYYLPYDNDHISSMRLPDPPPIGVDFFLTANMSGCKFYIDTINGSADLMVYHANARGTAPAPANSAADFQDPLAAAELDRLHNAAQADYTAAPHNLVLANAASLDKPTYYGGGALAETRKGQAHSRPWVPSSTPARTLGVHQAPLIGPMVVVQMPPEFWGGCSVFGFYNAGWSFHYQTWGAVSYDRPTGAAAVAKAVVTGHWNSLGKLRTHGSHHGIDSRYNKVVAHAQFH
jgi:hypothetical protein